jgi:hypothetical protein
VPYDCHFLKLKASSMVRRRIFGSLSRPKFGCPPPPSGQAIHCQDLLWLWLKGLFVWAAAVKKQL